MGRLLAALIEESGRPPVATPATRATVGRNRPAKVAESQKSHGLGITVAADEAERLLTAIRAELLPDDLVGASDAAPGELSGLNDAALRACARMLHESVGRRCGRVPADETAVAICRHCGPIWVAPEVAAVAPVVDGLPRLLGCAWCHVRDRAVVPHPPLPVETEENGR
jgi:hypothetical protein